jgi:hypothetical protein
LNCIPLLLLEPVTRSRCLPVPDPQYCSRLPCVVPGTSCRGARGGEEKRRARRLRRRAAARKQRTTGYRGGAERRSVEDGFRRTQDWEGDWLAATLAAAEALARSCLDLLLIPRWSRRLEAVVSTWARWSRRWLAGRVSMLLAESQGGHGSLGPPENYAPR